MVPVYAKGKKMVSDSSMKGKMMLLVAVSLVCIGYIASINTTRDDKTSSSKSTDVVHHNQLDLYNQYYNKASSSDTTTGVPSEVCTGSDPSVLDHYNHHYSMKELAPLYTQWTMVGIARQILALEAIATLNLNKVPGEIVECGVWKGGMTMAMIFANMKDNTDRHFWLYDTFEGLPKPTEKDDKRAHDVWAQVQKGDPTVNDVGKHRVEDGKWNYGALSLVKSNVYYTHYPRDKIHFIKGKVEDTLPTTKLPEKIALLRLDTDFYDSTKFELEYLWDRLVPGGLLIIDDFFSWGGARTAVIEFFTDKLGLDAVEIAKKGPCMHYWKK
jgi:O-methyltransferase